MPSEPALGGCLGCAVRMTELHECCALRQLGRPVHHHPAERAGETLAKGADRTARAALLPTLPTLP